MQCRNTPIGKETNMYFSIIIPAHNEENNIMKALESIRIQSFQNYEVIVVCDACTDNTHAVAQTYGARVIDVDFHSPGASRNAGLDIAQGKWVLFMDADDWYLHEYVLEQLRRHLGDNRADVVLFAIIWKHIGYGPIKNKDGKYFTHVANKCWRRSSIGNTRFPTVRPAEDAVFWERMVERGIVIDEWDMPLYYYNYLRKGSTSDQLGRTAEHTKQYWGLP